MDFQFHRVAECLNIQKMRISNVWILFAPIRVYWSHLITYFTMFVDFLFKLAEWSRTCTLRWQITYWRWWWYWWFWWCAYLFVIWILRKICTSGTDHCKIYKLGVKIQIKQFKQWTNTSLRRVLWILFKEILRTSNVRWLSCKLSDRKHNLVSIPAAHILLCGTPQYYMKNVLAQTASAP